MKAILVGVTGGSASGKTEIARATARAVAPLTSMVISEDDYYDDHGGKPDFDAAAFNFDHPESRDHGLLASQLADLKTGRAIEAPVYDFTIHRRRDDTRRLEPVDVVLVEGIHVFCDERVRQQFDICVFVDAPDDVRLARRVLRDVNERGRTAHSVINQYLKTVRPMHHEWTRSGQNHADIHIENIAAAARPSDHLTDFFDELAIPVVEAIREQLDNA